MQCANCGKDIPFNGNVCPWCHTGKSRDKQRTAITYCVAVIGMGIGYLVNGTCGVVAGAFIGGIVGAVAANILI
jgi:hypothetical protein